MNDLPVDDIVSCFPLRLQNIIKEVFMDGKIGISSQYVKFHVLNNKVLQESLSGKRNFMLEIPYASKQLYWEIVFNDEDDSFAPDFEFTNDTFLSDPDTNVISRHIPTLAQWNINDPKSLINVIREFLILYKKTQISILQDREVFSRLYNEYNLLISKSVPEESIEVYVERNGFVHFLININVNFSSLPPYIQPILLGDNYNLLNPCEDTAALRISFTKADGSRYSSDLQFSPRLEQVIGNASTLHIPKLNKEKGLNSYVLEINRLLTEKVENLSHHFASRKEYIQVLLNRCSQNIVEYNNKLFTYASIFCEVDEFPVLVIVRIGKSFPQEKPKILLQSLFQMHNSKAVSIPLDNYPYSPRWKFQEMIERLLNYLNAEIAKFVNVCQNLLEKDKN